jgi:hypothetical protein
LCLISGTAKDINIQNVNNTDTHYSKYKKVKVSLADVLGTIAKNPLLLKKESDGKVSFTLAQMGLAFGYFNGFWWFFCFKNSGFVFNERVELYFYDKRVAPHFFKRVASHFFIFFRIQDIPFFSSWGFAPNP